MNELKIESINNRIVGELSLKEFNALPQTGKPNEKEWTILSCIVKEQKLKFEVVALGTGSKCIGETKMCPNGTIVNDSHAEVICRRAFLSDKFKFSLKPDIKFHFFTTHVPCGDAAIFPKTNIEDFGSIVMQADHEEIPTKKRKVDKDIYRTGAKCLKNDTKQDLKFEGSEYHVIGVVRTKPGRGDPTASVSCSDKLSKWCHLGIQGTLLMVLLDTPIYLATFTILSKTPFCEKALNRALYDRLEKPELLPPYDRHLLDVQTVDLEFTYSKREDRIPCSSSIAWFKTDEERYFEVAVNGRKQGITKKHLSSEKGRLKICKLELFKTFVNKLKEFNFNLESDIESLTYNNAKKLDKTYQENWTRLKKTFGVWSKKDPALLAFVITQL